VLQDGRLASEEIDEDGGRDGDAGETRDVAGARRPGEEALLAESRRERTCAPVAGQRRDRSRRMGSRHPGECAPGPPRTSGDRPGGGRARRSDRSWRRPEWRLHSCPVARSLSSAPAALGIRDGGGATAPQPKGASARSRMREIGRRMPREGNTVHLRLAATRARATQASSYCPRTVTTTSLR
jgi:hypothetical protein